MEAAIEAIETTLGQKRVKPWAYLRLSAQTTSIKPERIRNTQLMPSVHAARRGEAAGPSRPSALPRRRGRVDRGHAPRLALYASPKTRRKIVSTCSVW